jgi:hypothetical protein
MISILGYKVIESRHMVVTEAIQRTWRERLFSRPWRPWRKTRIICKPDPNVYILDESQIVVHPEIMELWRLATTKEKAVDTHTTT